MKWQDIAAWLSVAPRFEAVIMSAYFIAAVGKSSKCQQGFDCCAVTFHFYGLSKLWWLTQLPSSILWKDITATAGSCWRVSWTGTSSKTSFNLMGLLFFFFLCHLGFGWLLFTLRCCDFLVRVKANSGSPPSTTNLTNFPAAFSHLNENLEHKLQNQPELQDIWAWSSAVDSFHWITFN